jgi:hypothetical protein
MGAEMGCHRRGPEGMGEDLRQKTTFVAKGNGKAGECDLDAETQRRGERRGGRREKVKVERVDSGDIGCFALEGDKCPSRKQRKKTVWFAAAQKSYCANNEKVLLMDSITWMGKERVS